MHCNDCIAIRVAGSRTKW